MEELYVLRHSVIYYGYLKESCSLVFLDDDAKAPAAKHLAKWRPHVLASENKTMTLSGPNASIKSEERQNESMSPGPLANPAPTREGEQMKANQGALPVAAAG